MSRTKKWDCSVVSVEPYSDSTDTVFFYVKFFSKFLARSTCSRPEIDLSKCSCSTNNEAYQTTCSLLSVVSSGEKHIQYGTSKLKLVRFIGQCLLTDL